MLLEYINKTQVKRENAILVGDSTYDAKGTADVGIDFIAAT